MSSATPPPMAIGLRTPRDTSHATSHSFESTPKHHFPSPPRKSRAFPPPLCHPHSPQTSTSTSTGLEAQSHQHQIDLCLTFLLNSHHRHQLEATASPAEVNSIASVASSAKQIHAKVCKLGLVADKTTSNKLAILYSKAQLENSALQMFDEIPERTVPLYASLIGSFARSRRWEDVLFVFVLMVGEGVQPDKFLLPKILKACSELRELTMGSVIHGYMIKEPKLEMDVFISNSLIDMYANCGGLESSKLVFDMMPERDVVSWTALVAAYADAGLLDDTFEIFQSMQLNGVVPDLISWNALISGFARNGDVSAALGLLEEMKEKGPKPGINSWNGVISGCVQSGWFEDALDVFLEMLSNETPNAITIASILPACLGLQELSLGEGLHAYAIKCNFKRNVYVGGSLIDMYLKCKKSECAEKVFSNLDNKTAAVWNEMIAAYANEGRMNEALEHIQSMLNDGLKPDVITYNTVLSAYARSGQKDEAFKRFSEMGQMGLKPNIVSLNTLVAGFQQSGLNREALELFRIMQLPFEFAIDGSHPNSSFPVDILNMVIHPNSITITSTLSACTALKFKRGGKEIHGYALRNCLEANVFVSSALVDVYAKCEDINSAACVFRGISEKNTVSWNVLMAGYNSNGKPEAALKLFLEMLELEGSPNSVTFMILLLACSNAAALNLGRGVHCYIVKNLLEESPVALQSALIDMYAKCGCVSEARLAFDCATQRDLGLWNAMISCYSLHGMATAAICLFEEMAESGVTPDHISFCIILSVCNQEGLVEEGWKYFNSMADVYDITPTLEHFTCMVGIMGDAGLLEEALDFIRRMPFEPDACVWATLLRSCKVHSNYEIGETAAKELFELEPTNTSNYIVLSNIYAMAGMWDAAKDIRVAMRSRGLRIVKACSWINIGNTIHAFKAGESSHLDMKKILEEWDKLAYEMEQAGYAPQDAVFHDEEEVDPFSCSHTEKLAICFGIISLHAHAPVRISKNVQMCIDCHTSAKFISKIDEREVFVRDGSFYHHFKDGTCSCKDKW